jgi:hypothetical protein
LRLPGDRIVDSDLKKRRFVHEPLNHPSIIAAHEIGKESGNDFIVIEYEVG